MKIKRFPYRIDRGIPSRIIILRFSAQPKMVRVSTQPVVPTWTIMAHAKANRDISSVEKPRQSVGVNFFRTNLDFAVSIFTRTAHPNPTSMRRRYFIESFPKTLDSLSRKCEALLRFVHNRCMTEFSCACSALTGTRYDFGGAS